VKSFLPVRRLPRRNDRSIPRRHGKTRPTLFAQIPDAQELFVGRGRGVATLLPGRAIQGRAHFLHYFRQLIQRHFKRGAILQLIEVLEDCGINLFVLSVAPLRDICLRDGLEVHGRFVDSLEPFRIQKAKWALLNEMTRMSPHVLRFKHTGNIMAGRKSKTHFERVPIDIAILKKEPNGKTYWVEAPHNVESAKERVESLFRYFPGEYVIVNKKTGEEITVRPFDGDGPDDAPEPAVN
jgi:hypothetical protein